LVVGVGGATPRDGHITCKNGDLVTWCAGHLLRQAEPHEVNPRWKKWSFDTLPITVPATGWASVPQKSASKQLGVIKRLLADRAVTVVVHAGDPGREGQLIVDEVLNYFGNRKPVQRVQLTSLDVKSITKALGALRDNKEFAPVCEAAEGRALADMLVGMNMTRAVTMCASKQGVDGGVLSVGRVQTPTLGLVVARDREIETFIPTDFFVPSIVANHMKGDFSATWMPRDDFLGLDSENRIVDRRVAEELVTKAKGQTGQVIQASYTEKSQGPTLPYSLSALQSEASSKFGFTASRTLELAQSLYERRYTSYPRTDSRYLPEEQFGEASEILANLAKYGLDAAAKATPSLRSKAWNTAKITEHHAIIPTGEVPSGLSDDERTLYRVIANSYIRQFFPNYRYVEQAVIVEIAGERWKGTGRQDVDRGWKSVGGSEELKAGAIPAGVRQGDSVTCTDGSVSASQTKPPSYFTDGSLIDAMTHIDRHVKDIKIKKCLKEAAGLGTEATRANIIETLVTRKYVSRKGKQLRSTEIGRTLIDNLPAPLVDPGTTALWEMALDKVANGQLPLGKFLERQQTLVPQMIKAAVEKANFSGIAGPVYPCPECGMPLKRLKGKKGYFWACFNDEKHQDPVFAQDIKGKPGTPRLRGGDASAPKAPCPEPGCGEQMIRMESRKKAGVFFWRCANSEHPLRSDDDGKPGEAFGQKPKQSKGRRNARHS
jgi:DNA topoisomerase-3